MAHTHVNDAGLAEIADLPKLIELDIADAPVTDSGMEHFKVREGKRDEFLCISLGKTKVTPGMRKQLFETSAVSFRVFHTKPKPKYPAPE